MRGPASAPAEGFDGAAGAVSRSGEPAGAPAAGLQRRHPAGIVGSGGASGGSDDSAVADPGPEAGTPEAGTDAAGDRPQPLAAAGDGQGIAVEDAPTDVSGRLTLAVPGASATATWQAINPVSDYGTLTVQPDGRWSFALDNANPLVQQLAEGQSVVQTFAVMASDGHGGFTTARVSVTIQGANDAPVVLGSSETGGAVREDDAAAAVTTGRLTATDIDVGSHLQWSVGNADGQFGSLAVDPESGQWTYHLDNGRSATQALAAGQSGTDSFTVTVTDEHGATATVAVAVSVAGTNDAPTIAGSSVATGLVHEDAAKTAVSGQLQGIDSDAGAHLSWTLSGTDGLYGSIAIDPATGQWTYTLDNARAATSALPAGQRATEVFTATVTDEHGLQASRQIAVTVVGADDRPSLLPVAEVQVDEGAAVLKGQLLAVDPDTGDTLTFGNPGPVHGFTLDSAGRYSFDPADPHYDNLAAGQRETVSIPVTVTDSSGAVGQQVLTIVVTGTDDWPVMTLIPSMHAAEDGAVVHGQLSATDPDTGDTLTYSMPGPVNGFMLNADGSYSFDPSHADFQHLAAGQPLEIDVPVAVTDSQGATDTQVLRITVTGTEDLPVVAVVPPMGVTEGQALVHGRLTATDADSTDTVTFTTTATVAGFTLNADGSYSFDPADPAYDHLEAGRPQVLSVPVDATDSSGGTVSQTLQITVTGTDDRPVIGVVATRTVDEDGTVSGRILASDVDDGDTVRFHVPAAVGGLTLNPDGTFTFDASGPEYQNLAAGAVRDLSIPVVATDGQGATDQTVLHIRVVGTDDRPLIGGIDHAMGAVQSAVAGTVSISGRLSVLDLDQGESAFQSQILQGSYGILAIGPDGGWSYSADARQPSLVGLGATDHVDETFVVRTADGTQHDITLVIKGENSPAVIGGVDAALVNEDQAGAVGGRLAIIDPDAGEQAFVAIDRDTDHGHFTLDADGSWHFTLNNADPRIQALPEQQGLTERIVVGSVDGTPHVVTVSIVGRNDGPAIAGAATGQLTEDASTQARGLLSATDVDTGARLTWSVDTTAGTYGTVTVDPATGAWSYALDNARAATQGLTAGEVETETFTATVTDEHGASSQTTITVRVTGTGDAPVISGTATGSVDEDRNVDASGQLHTSGQLSVTDADAGEASFQAGTLTGQYGSLTIDASGQWTYQVDNGLPGVQQLDTGQSAQDHFTVQTADGTRQAVVITVNGLDEHVQIGGVTTGEVTEDGVGTIVHQLTATGGAHPGQAAFADAVIAGQYGSVDLRADGRWIYTLDNGNPAVQALADGVKVTDTITVTAKDGTTQDLTVTVVGSHDLPVISTVGSVAAHTITSVTQLGAPTAASALDGFATGTTGVATGVHLVGLYMPGSDANRLAGVPAADLPTVGTDYRLAGVSGFSYLSTRGWFSSRVPGVDFTAVGENTRNTWDNGLAVFSDGTVVRLQKVCEGQAGGQEKDYVYYTPYQGVTAQGGTVVSGTAAAGETVTVYAGSTRLGEATADANGEWTLGVARMPDGDHALHTVIGGAASAPQVFAFSGDTAVERPGALGLGGVAEGTAVDTVSGDLQVSDIDAADNPAFTVQAATAGTYGSFSIDANGHWTYTLDNSRAVTQALPDGTQRTETFTVEVTTASGETVTRDVTVVVTGSNEGPVLSGPATGALTEDGTATTASGVLVVTDPDTGDSPSIAPQSGTAGTFGTFSVNADGTWTYTLDNARAATQGLAGGQVETETFTVTATDASGVATSHDVTITVTGTADAPVVAGADTGAVKEDAASTASGSLSVTDADTGDAPSFTAQTDVPGTYGTFSVATDGTWTYTLDNSKAATQGLSEGEQHQEVFTVTATDASGLSTAHGVTVTVTGSHEAPVVSGPVDLGAVQEDATLSFSAADLMARSSMEGGGTLSVVAGSLTSPHGTFTGDAATGFVFHPNADYAGQDVEIAYKVTDGATEVDTRATVNVTSVTDKAAVTMTMTAEQEVITTGPSDQSGRIQVDRLASGALSAFTLEFTVIGKAVPDTGASTGPVVVNIGHTGDNNMLSLWNPGNMKIGGAGDVATGINLGDGSSHRITLTWDSASGGLKVFDNGELRQTIANYHQGSTLPDDLYMVVGGKMNNPATKSGFNPGEHYEGQVFNTALADRALSPDEVKAGPLASQVDKTSGLIIDVRSVGGSLQDATGHHSLSDHGGIGHQAMAVDTVMAVPPPGSRLSLSVGVQAPSDPDDHVTAVRLRGFLAGTVLGDGTHVHTVTGSDDAVDITAWRLSAMTAQLPAGVSQNMRIATEVTTTGPDGMTATSEASQPLVLNPAQPIPNAVIAGDDAGSTDEDSAVSGTLTVTDADAGEAHFVAASLDGRFGRLDLAAGGHWTYTPDARADALADGTREQDSFVVGSADGSSHRVVITLAGTDDAPAISGVDTGSVVEDATATASGTLTLTDPDTADAVSVVPQTDVSGTYGTFSVGADGTWTYTLDNGRAATQGLGEGEQHQEVFTVTATDAGGTTTTHDVTVTVTGSHEAPVVSGPVDLGAIREDATLSFSAADLLARASMEGGGTLSLVAGSLTSPHGTFTGDAATGFVFHPNADYAGQDVEIAYRVTDGTTEVDTRATVDVTSVTDKAQVSLGFTTEQQVMTFDASGTGSIMNNGPLQTGVMDHFAVEFTIVGGPQVATAGVHGATFMSYGVPGNSDEFYLWKPEDLTVRIGGHEYPTGIDTTDGQTHRYTMLWSSATGTVDVLVDGVPTSHLDGVGRGYHIPGGGLIALAQDQDRFQLEDGSHLSGHGFAPQDAFHGQIFNAAFANVQVDPADLAGAPLANLLDGQPGLIANLQMSPEGHPVDTTGNHQVSQVGGVNSQGALVDGSVAVPNPGALLHLQPSAVATDPDDHVVRLEIMGLSQGTVLSDGTHSHTVTGPDDRVDIQGWDHGQLTAQLPAGVRENMAIGLVATTQGPDGAEATASTTTPLVLDPTAPVPDAVVAGDDAGSTGEDQAITGTLTVADSDAGQDHFSAESLDGQYGRLELKANGEWSYTPDSRADALADGERQSESFLVRTADGSQHVIGVTLAGTNDQPVLAGTMTGSVTEGATDAVTGIVTVSDPDTGDHASIAAQAAVQGTFGTFEIDATGAWTYRLDNSLPETQALGHGESQQEIFTVSATDGQGETVTHDIAIDVTGAGDDTLAGGAVVAGLAGTAGASTGGTVDPAAVLDASLAPASDSLLTGSAGADDLHLGMPGQDPPDATVAGGDAVSGAPAADEPDGANHVDAPILADPLQGYMAFASHDLQAAGPVEDQASMGSGDPIGSDDADAVVGAAADPLAGYLAAAGVDPADLQPLPAAGTGTDHGGTGAEPGAGASDLPEPVDTADADVILVDDPAPVAEDDQHHGV